VKLLVVFCSPSHDLPLLMRMIRARSGDVPLVGCTTAGEIATGANGDASVVVAALGGPGFAIQTAAASDASRDLRAAGARAARCLGSDEDRPYRALLLLTDGLAGDQQEIVRGAYGVLGADVPLVGGCAGDDLKMTKTYQLHGDRVLTDSVLAAGIASDAPLGIGVRHGWRPVGEPMLVTQSGGNRVYTLDDRPALDVYLDHLGAEHAGLDEERLTRLALMHPLGLSRPAGEAQVRFIGGGELEERIARRGVLGDHGIRAEVERLAASAAGAPVAGFYTYGEIARTRGMRGFHNQTLVVLSIG
jgi:hypothetical protein